MVGLFEVIGKHLPISFLNLRITPGFWETILVDGLGSVEEESLGVGSSASVWLETPLSSFPSV